MCVVMSTHHGAIVFSKTVYSGGISWKASFNADPFRAHDTAYTTINATSSPIISPIPIGVLAPYTELVNIKKTRIPINTITSIPSTPSLTPLMGAYRCKAGFSLDKSVADKPTKNVGKMAVHHVATDPNR